MTKFITTLAAALHRPIGVAPAASAMDVQLLMEQRQMETHVRRMK